MRIHTVNYCFAKFPSKEMQPKKQSKKAFEKAFDLEDPVLDINI